MHKSILKDLQEWEKNKRDPQGNSRDKKQGNPENVIINSVPLHANS